MNPTKKELSDMTIKVKTHSETTGIVLQLPNDLSRQIDRQLIDLADLGIKTLKSEYCIKLIQIGLQHSKL